MRVRDDSSVGQWAQQRSSVFLTFLAATYRLERCGQPASFFFLEVCKTLVEEGCWLPRRSFRSHCAPSSAFLFHISLARSHFPALPPSPFPLPFPTSPPGHCTSTFTYFACQVAFPCPSPFAPPTALPHFAPWPLHLLIIAKPLAGGEGKPIVATRRLQERSGTLRCPPPHLRVIRYICTGEFLVIPWLALVGHAPSPSKKRSVKKGSVPQHCSIMCHPTTRSFFTRTVPSNCVLILFISTLFVSFGHFGQCQVPLRPIRSPWGVTLVALMRPLQRPL